MLNVLASVINAYKTDNYNTNRRLVEQLYDLRSDRPWQVLTYELYLLLRAGNLLEVEEHIQQVLGGGLARGAPGGEGSQEEGRWGDLCSPELL